MKRMMTVALTLLIPCLASAQQGNSGQFELRLPPSMQQCLDMMCNGQHRPPVPPPAVKQDKPEPKKAVRKGPNPVTILAKRVALIEVRITQLRKTTEGLLAKVGQSNRDAEIDQLKAELEALRKRLTEISAMLAENAIYDARGVAALGKRIDNLKESLRGLNGSNLKFGPTAGFLVLKSNDGTLYTTSSFGADLQLKLDWKWDLRVGASLLVSDGERHLGTAVRAGLDFNFSRLFFVNFGLNGVWAGMNSRLHASNAFAAADAGFGLKWKLLRAGASLLVGVEFDKNGSPDFAVGAMGTVGLILP